MQAILAWVAKNLAMWLAKLGAGIIVRLLMKYVRKWLRKEAKERQKIRRRIMLRLSPKQVASANAIRVHEVAQRVRGRARSAMLTPWTEKDFRLARLELYKDRFPKRWVSYMRDRIIQESDDTRPHKRRT